MFISTGERVKSTIIPEQKAKEERTHKVNYKKKQKLFLVQETGNGSATITSVAGEKFRHAE